MARTPLSRARATRDEPDPADAWRPRLRQPLRYPHAGRGAVRRAARPALLARAPQAGVRPAAAIGQRAFRRATHAVTAERTVLTAGRACNTARTGTRSRVCRSRSGGALHPPVTVASIPSPDVCAFPIDVPGSSSLP